LFLPEFPLLLNCFVDKIKETDEEMLSLKTKLKKLTQPSIPSSTNAMTLIPLGNLLATHAFLTHNWGSQSDNFENHRRVAKIYRILEKNYNMKMWFDEIKLNGDIRREITQGIKNTRCMIVFLTKEYDRKISGESEGIYCQLEFNQGFQKFYRDGKLIPIVMEEEMLNTANWSDDLRGVFEGKFFFNFSQMYTMSEEDFSKKCKELFEFIIKKLR
jgi:competence CoiA-like predicted nuclease